MRLGQDQAVELPDFHLTGYDMKSSGKLYHGTSGTIAQQIVHSGGICPPASSHVLAKHYFLQNNPHPPNQRYVYLVPEIHEAIMFGVSRVLGKWKVAKGSWKPGEWKSNFVTGKGYDRVVIFVVNTEDLNPSLFRESTLFPGEVAYEGVIKLAAGMQLVEFPLTRELWEFQRAVQTPELEKYVGLDLMKYFQGKTFEVHPLRNL